MKAGRELDIRIGTTIMGWELVPEGTRGYLRSTSPVFSKMHGYDDFELLVDHYKMPQTDEKIKKWGRGTLVPTHIYRFSDPDGIADAWLVVEKLAQTQVNGHVGPTLLHHMHLDATGRYDVCFCSDFGYTPMVHADTAPLAICLAALKAVSETCTN